MYNTGARMSEALGLRVGDVVVDGTAVAQPTAAHDSQTCISSRERNPRTGRSNHFIGMASTCSMTSSAVKS
jgi:hypothetical protein